MSKLNVRNIQTSEKQKLTRNLFARFLKNEIGRLELALIVDENTTLADIEKAWNSIKYKTSQILEVQGTDPNNYYQLSRLRLAKLYLVEGFSYTDVAMEANYDTLVNVVQILSHMNAGDIEKAMSIYQAVFNRLVGLGIKPATAHKSIKESLEEVKEGRAPWSLADGPVKKQRIVDLVRQLAREIEQGTIVIKENPPGIQRASAKLGEIADRNKDFWETAQNLLRQLPKSGGFDKLQEAHRRYLKTQKG